MAKYDFDMGILGGGAAGLTVAAGAAQLGAKVLLIDTENRLGGDCLHFGCIPSKTLIKTAKVRHQATKMHRYGLPDLESKPVDFAAVAARIQSVIETIQKHDSVERFCGLGVKVEFGNARFTDEHAIRLNGKSHSAKTWVIATGSSPSIPPIEGIKNTPCLTNRELFSLDHLPSSMIFLGAGPIAAEMAQAFTRLGSTVTVVQRSGRILGKEDKDMADAVMTALRSEGVTFHLDAATLRVADLGSEKEVVIKKGEDTLNLRAEVIVAALGRDANAEDMGLDGLGMEFDRKGIRVDSRMRTNRRHIYAAGDVTGRYQFTHAAGYEGGIVVANAIFHLPRKADYTFLPWCTYTDPELACIGMNETTAGEKGIRCSVWTEEFSMNDRSLTEGEETGKIKMILNEKEKPIGVQILGPHAGDLLGEWVAILNGGMKLAVLAGAVHPYPTRAEINKKVVGTFIAKKIFSENVKKMLKLFFNFKGGACRIDDDKIS